MTQIELIDDELCDTGIYYIFRDKRTHLYVGYDGFDTDFVKGISAFIKHHEIVEEFNKKLVIKTHPEIINLLTTQTMGSKEWKQLGGINNIEIVRLELITEGRVFTPSGLLNLISRDDTDIDYEEVETE